MDARAERLLSLRFAAQADRLRDTRKAVREALESGGLGPDCAADVVMAIDEACQNIIRHAYGGESEQPIQLEIERRGDALVISLVDYAPSVDPDCMKPRELDEIRPGGLGTHFIREVMDEVAFAPPPPGCGNLLRMVKRVL